MDAQVSGILFCRQGAGVSFYLCRPRSDWRNFFMVNLSPKKNCQSLLGDTSMYIHTFLFTTLPHKEIHFNLLLLLPLLLLFSSFVHTHVDAKTKGGERARAPHLRWRLPHGGWRTTFTSFCNSTIIILLMFFSLSVCYYIMWSGI